MGILSVFTNYVLLNTSNNKRFFQLATFDCQRVGQILSNDINPKECACCNNHRITEIHINDIQSQYMIGKPSI